jgi:hypothetical protein
MLEASLVKKTCALEAGPPGVKKLTYISLYHYIIDDIMPSPDKYGSQSPISFLNQLKDDGCFYDLSMPDMLARGVPLTAGFDPMNLLTDSSKTAGWQTEGLPADPLSTQNTSNIRKCARFPLIIDPQMQAVAWINGREKPNGLVTTVPGTKGWLNMVLEEGVPLLLGSLNSVVLVLLWLASLVLAVCLVPVRSTSGPNKCVADWPSHSRSYRNK